MHSLCQSARGFLRRSLIDISVNHEVRVAHGLDWNRADKRGKRPLQSLIGSAPWRDENQRVI